MRTRSSCVVFIILAFFLLTLPFPAGAVVDWDWTNRHETDLVTGFPGAWDDYEILAPNVIKDGGTYKMWYTGKSSAGPYQIGYATSSDGVAWTKHPGNPIITPADAGTWGGLPVQGIGKCAVIKTGSNYEMWYSAGTSDDDRGQIGYATSSDGTTWAHHGSPVLTKGPAGDWDAEGAFGPAVIKDGSTYRMWYEGRGAGQPGIGYAESLDGINWTKYNNPQIPNNPPYANSNPVIRLGPNRSWNGQDLGSPTVIKEDTKYHLWHYGNSGDPADSRDRIGYAYSGDGFNWRPYTGNPLLHPGAPSAYDGGGVQDPVVIKDGNTYRMWYYGVGTGAVGTPRGKINYADSSAYQGNTLVYDKISVSARYESARSGIHVSIKGRFPSPLDITQCTVSGPNGFSASLDDSRIYNDEKQQHFNMFTQIMPFPPGVTSAYSGTYTFTMKTNNGLTATKSVDLAISPMVVPTEPELDRYVNATAGTNVYAETATPTLKWKPYPGDNYYYRVNVQDWKQAAGWYVSGWALGSSKDGDGYMSVTIPSGRLKANTPYKWKVQIADTDPTGKNFNGFNRIDSGFYAFYTGAKGTGNFLSFISFQRMDSYMEGSGTTMGAGVVDLAPWDIATVDPNKFRVENETYATPYYYTFVHNTADALTTDPFPFMYFKMLNGPSIADTSGLGYKFFVSDGSNSSELYAPYVNPSIAKPQLTRDQMTPRDNAYLQTLEPTLAWKSDGTAYKYRVMIMDWNTLRIAYMSSYLDGLEAGQDMSLTVPAGILQGSSPYRWCVDIFDSGMYNRMRTEILSFETPSAPASSLYANFTGYGLYKWNGSAWNQINTGVPASMVASGSLLYADYGGALWQWNGTAWSKINTAVPTSMVASGSLLYADYGAAGLWQWNGTAWSRINTGVPASMVGSGSLLYADYGGALWQWNGTAWSKINTAAPTSMVASGTMLYANYGAAGLWQWNGTAWSRINTGVPTSMVGSGSLLYADYGGALWQWGTAWSKINTGVPASMVASGPMLYADYGGALWQWNGTAWSKINTGAPASMAAGF